MALLVGSGCLCAGEVLGNSRLTFCCSPSNDLYVALGKPSYPRFASPTAAIQHAAPGSAVLLLADGYPERTTAVQPGDWDLAQEKHLRLLIEYPAAIPGLEVTAPRTTVWERIVVSSDKFGPELPRMRLLAAHDCHFTPVSGPGIESLLRPQPAQAAGTSGFPKADLVVARVAGYDTAIYGLPESGTFPILFAVAGAQPDRGHHQAQRLCHRPLRARP